MRAALAIFRLRRLLLLALALIWLFRVDDHNWETEHRRHYSLQIQDLNRSLALLFARQNLPKLIE